MIDISSYKQRIAKGNALKAIFKELRSQTTSYELKEINNLIILKESEYNKIEIENREGVIFQNDYRVYLNRINKALISILDEIDSNQQIKHNQQVKSNQQIPKKKIDVTSLEKHENYVLIFGRDTVGKTSIISSIGRYTDGVSYFDIDRAFRYFPTKGESDLLELELTMPYREDEIPKKVTFIEMTDSSMKEIILFRPNDKPIIGTKNISQLYILTTDFNSGEKDDFSIAMYIKILCENLENLSFIIVVNKWDYLLEGHNKYLLDKNISIDEYMERFMPLTKKMLTMNEVKEKTVLSYSVKNDIDNNHEDTRNLINLIKRKYDAQQSAKRQ